MYFTILWTISLLTFLSYTIFLLLKHPGIKSYSYSYYVIKHPAIFTFFTWGYAIPLVMISGKLLFFLAGALIAFVGVAGDYMSKKDKTIFKIHMAGSYGGVLLGIAGLWVHLGLWYLSIFSIVGIVLLYLSKVKGKIFWIEFYKMLIILIIFYFYFL